LFVLETRESARNLLAKATALCLAAATVTAVVLTPRDEAGQGVTARPPVAMLTTSISPGAEQVGITDPLVITSVGGTLAAVTVTGRAGAPLEGTLSPDRTRWTSGPLDYNVTYTVNATGTGPEGRPIDPLTSTFRTVRPNRTLQVDGFRPSNGQTVGVAMPISIYFNHPVRDKAAVERRLSVTPSVPTEGSFNWVADDQVNWRPRHFWAAGTTVKVAARLRGVDAASGTFGARDQESSFTVGRAQEAVGDAQAHTLTLLEDGKVKQVMPASFGRPQYPTQYGIHVAFEKHLTKRMRSDNWGGPEEGEDGFYDMVLPLAVRISGNGEFVHVNGATVGQQGRSNVSHGCVNISPANGRIFYDWVQIGDPVNIINSTRPLTPKDGDISDWLIPWEQYAAGSALRPTAKAAAPDAETVRDLPRVTQ
jgi:lipoprotein-anchoring transpeptidase ErfK/SrfK